MKNFIAKEKFRFFQLALWLTTFFIVVFLTLSSGAVPFAEVLEGTILRLNGASSNWNPLLDERLPRLIVLLFSGASLAVAGATMQALFRTPLAAPSLLGTSAGGSLLMFPTILLQWQLSLPYALPLSAVVGSLAALFLVYGLSRWTGNLTTSGLLLIGLAISSLLLSIEGAIHYAFRTNWQQIQLLSELSTGSTANLGWLQVHLLLPLAIIGLGGCLYYSWELDIISLSDEEALSLGVEVRKVRYRLFLCIAMLTGATLASIGNIAFYGLLLPCALRAIFGACNRRLIPLCICWGGVGLCSIDLLLRFFDLHALSIGHLSALSGSILFLWLLIKKG